MHTHKICVWKEKNILFFLLLCPRTRFFSFLIHIHRDIGFLCSAAFFWNDTRTSFTSIVHGIGVLCPCHQRLGLSTGTLGHRRPYPPPARTSPCLWPLHRRPYVFVLATNALIHRRPSICWPPTTSHIILLLIKVTFFIPLERCVSLIVVAGIPMRSPSPP